MMDACTNDNFPMADRASPPCETAAAPGKKRLSRFRKIASGCVFWIGAVLIAVTAIPAGILLGIMYLIVWAMNFFTDKIEKG